MAELSHKITALVAKVKLSYIILYILIATLLTISKNLKLKKLGLTMFVILSIAALIVLFFAFTSLESLFH